MSLPVGTVTFMFTDIEGSTQLMQKMGDAYVEAQQAHHAILRSAFQARQGSELRTEGDSFFCVFESALDACRAAAAAQLALASHEWPESGRIKVRMGLHTGEAPLVGNEYIGLEVHHAARVAAAAHGGQVLVSEATRALVESSLPEGVHLQDLGAHRLKDLARPERLFQLVVEGLEDAFPALRTLDITPNNLPTQLTSFVGREADVAEARKLLEGTRLLTLVGPGGIGKTRLSLQLAADLGASFPDGIYFVPLSAVTDPALVASTIALALGRSATGDQKPSDVVAEHLKERSVLLVLDNFEQLLPDAGPVISDLLRACPKVKAVVSSRAPLRVYGEQEMAVQPLRLPDLKALPSLAALSQFEAVKLFIERAVAAKHDFQVTNENAPAVAAICERVDGLPLALELAAARVKLFSPQALLGRLESSLNVLAGGARDLPSRQQTLRAAIAWSYDLLDEPEKRHFRHLSVFARGANLEQAEAVCPAEEGADVLTRLEELADQSLLRLLPDTEEPRLLMLQVIREFAAEKLAESGEAEAVRDRHADAYQALLEKAAPNFFGADQKQWLDRVQTDHDNLRAACDWSLARGDVQRALCLVAASWRFWQMRGHLREARTRIEAALAMPGAPEHPAERARALEAAGGIVYWLGDLEAAKRYYGECLSLGRAAGDQRATAEALYNLSFPVMLDGDVDDGLDLVEEAVELYRAIGDESGIARSLWAIANVHHQRDEEDVAVGPLDEAIGLFRGLGDRFSLAWALHTRTVVALGAKDLEGAERYAREGLATFWAAGDVSGVVLLIDDLAATAKVAGNLRRAFQLAGAAEAEQVRTGAKLAAVVNVNEGRSWYQAIATEEERQAWATGQAMSIEQAVDYALAGERAMEAATDAG